MKLILAQYLRTLKERDEFDRLLPDLLLAMGYVSISKPQTGVRQYGVDLAAVGVGEDGIEELLLLVIKRGDIGRTDWDTGTQAVRPSLNEVIDVYLKSHVEPDHELLRKRIVLATTGDLKQETQINWDGYTKQYADRAAFSFWGGDRIAVLIEKYMLNENILDADSRTHLRKSLALAGEPDYDQRDLHRLFRRQLGLGNKGDLLEPTQSPRDLQKSLSVVNLSAQIFARWSEEEGNLKQALIASERAMLWSWHRINLEATGSATQYHRAFGDLWRSYKDTARRYFTKVQDHLYVKDGLSGYCRENVEFSLVVFEQIGLLATIGLSQVMLGADKETKEVNLQNGKVVAHALAALLPYNTVSGSPRLDENVIDITLGLLLLVQTGFISQAQDWLAELVTRADYTFKRRRQFAIGTDSIDDLVEMEVSDNEELRARLMRTSWLLPTLAAWSAILDRDDLYEIIARNSKTRYSDICLQLWHPSQDVAKHLYYSPAHDQTGESEAPISLPDTAGEFRARMRAVLAIERRNIMVTSPACLIGMDALDLVAYRHFRTPVAPFFWYRLLPNEDSTVESEMNGANVGT
jgi:hypothetical protein